MVALKNPDFKEFNVLISSYDRWAHFNGDIGIVNSDLVVKLNGTIYLLNTTFWAYGHVGTQ